VPHVCPCVAGTCVGEKWAFYEREYDPSWLECQRIWQEKRAKEVHRGAAGWLCPLPVSDSVSLGYPACAGVEC
jgi:hypothetical protein